MKIYFALLSFWLADFSLVFLLVEISHLSPSLFSSDSMNNAFSLSWVLLFLREVFILFKFEKQLSDHFCCGHGCADEDLEESDSL